MFDLPLHPAVVHLPLAGALFAPLVAAFVASRPQSRDAWWIGLGIQATTVLGALLAQHTGEEDGERVEHAVREALVHAHEEAAELFTAILVLALALWVAGFFARSRPARRALALAALFVGLAGLGAGLRVGHLGGELVYEHGAATWGTEEGPQGRLDDARSRPPAVRLPTWPTTPTSPPASAPPSPEHRTSSRRPCSEASAGRSVPTWRPARTTTAS